MVESLTQLGFDLLAPVDQIRLDRLESVIARGLDTFIEVGFALSEIKQARLYRQTHSTFDEYCRDRWKMAARTAYQLIKSSEVADDLKGLELPSSESIARVLTPLNREDRRDAWLLALRASEHVTAERLQAFLKSIRKIGYNRQVLAPVTQSQCPKCGHVYELTRVEKASRGNRRPSWCVPWVFNMLGSGLTAIDYGCGRFRNTEYIAKHFDLVASVDTFIQCQRIKPIMPANANLMDCNQFTVSNTTADVAFLIAVVHITDQGQSIANILKPRVRYVAVEFPRGQAYYKHRQRKVESNTYYREPTDADVDGWFDPMHRIHSITRSYNRCYIYAHN